MATAFDWGKTGIVAFRRPGADEINVKVEINSNGGCAPNAWTFGAR
jgi:hypothetical protein